VLTWRSLLTLVYVLTAVHPLVTTCTGTSVRAIDGACVADRISMAWVRRAGIIQMAQQSCLSWCTPAVETAHPINASGTIEASSTCAVIDIDTTVRACPAIDTDA